MSTSPTITRSEWGRVALLGALLLLLTTLPYIVGWQTQPNDAYYSGQVVGVRDGFSYIGKMRLGVDGHWRFHIFYTSEPHEAVALTFLPYILPGQALRLFTDSDAPRLYTTMILTFHGLRLVFGAALMIMVYRFIAVFLDGPTPRLTAWIVALVGGGWGWLVMPSGAIPPEWYIPEAFGFFLIYTLPHLALARAALLGGILALFASERNRGYAVVAGLLWCVAGLSVPFYMAVMYAVLGIWGVLLWVQRRAFPTQAFIRALMAFGVTLPLFSYYLWAFSANAVFAQWSAQNILQSPPPWHYLAAYGGLVALGVFAIRRAWASERGLWLLAWAIGGLTLVYLPLNVQRRLGEGVLVALAVLAVWGIQVLVETRGMKPGRLRLALLAWALPTTALFYMVTFIGVVMENPDLYSYANEVRAMAWLDDHTPESERGAVVLMQFNEGNVLPAYTNLRPYVGHGPETLNYEDKTTEVEAYFAGDYLPETRDAFYEQVDYVFFGLDDTPDFLADDELTLIYDEDGVTIFSVP
jgi:hypothetical protein